MRQILSLLGLLSLLCCIHGFADAQADGDQSVIFILRDGESDNPIQGATFTISCGDPARSDHRATLTDTFETIEYRPGTLLHCSIHCPRYKSTYREVTVDFLKSKNVVNIYLVPFEPPVRKTVQIEGYLYYMRDGQKRPAPGVEVTLQGVVNPKVVKTDLMGEYQLAFEVDELVDPDEGYVIVAGRDSYTFRVASQQMDEIQNQVYADIELIPYAANAAIGFRLYDPQTHQNITNATVQVLVDGKVVAESFTDENGNVTIIPEVEADVKRVMISIFKEDVLDISFKVNAADINNPYVINQQLKGDFDQILGSHLVQVGVGGSTDLNGNSHMTMLELYTGIGRSTTIFGGIGISPNWVKRGFFPDPSTDSHPDGTLSQVPVELLYKQYLLAPAKLGANMLWGWFFSFRTKGPGEIRRFYIGEGFFAGFRYCFVKNFGAEARVCIINSIWNYRDRKQWEVGGILSPNFQFTFNYTLPK